LIELGGEQVQAHHWFIFGMMVAWTPSMVVMAIALWRAAPEDRAHNS
jgi:hypothetical protein